MNTKLWVMEQNQFGVKVITDKVKRQLAFKHNWLKEMDLVNKSFCKI